MASHNQKITKEKTLKGLQPTKVSGHKGSVHPNTSHGKYVTVISAEIPSTSPCIFDGFSNPGQSNFDRKTEEMKAFLKRNPVPKEFLK